MSDFNESSDIFNLRIPEEKLKMSVPSTPEIFKFSNDTPLSNQPKRHNPKIEFLKESPEHVAEQLTIICSGMFSEINPEEFKNCAFEKKDKSSRTPFICKFQDFFNRTSAWVTKSVLDLNLTEKQRAEMITHFIKVAKRLFEQKNFHSLMSVVVSLERKAINRLKKTWKRVECKKTLDHLSEIISYDNNYEKLWSIINKSDVPCIPYLGLYTKRLVELDAAATLVTEGPDPRAVYDKLVTDIQYYQRSQDLYPLKEVPRVKTLLEKQLRDCYLEELERFFEAGITKISFEIEPEETPGCRTLKSACSNPLSPASSPKRGATMPRARAPLQVSNLMYVPRSPSPPEARAIGQSDADPAICNPLNVSTSTLPTDFTLAHSKYGHRKVKSYGGSTSKTDLEHFGVINPSFATVLSVPKGMSSFNSPEDARSLRSNATTSSGSSDSGSMDNWIETRPNGGQRQPKQFIFSVKLKMKDSSKMKLHRSHKYLLQLYETEIILIRRKDSTLSVDRFEIPLSQLPPDVINKFENNKCIYLPVGQEREVKLKPRPEDGKAFLDLLRLATKYSQAPHTTDLIDLSF